LEVLCEIGSYSSIKEIKDLAALPYPTLNVDLVGKLVALAVAREGISFEQVLKFYSDALPHITYFNLTEMDDADVTNLLKSPDVVARMRTLVLSSNYSDPLPLELLSHTHMYTMVVS
jgi:hypothetical protein